MNECTRLESFARIQFTHTSNIREMSTIMHELFRKRLETPFLQMDDRAQPVKISFS